jgi:hypothetical protein
VRLHSARSAELFDDAVEVSRAAANIKIRTQAETFRQIVSASSWLPHSANHWEVRPSQRPRRHYCSLSGRVLVWCNRYRS